MHVYEHASKLEALVTVLVVLTVHYLHTLCSGFPQTSAASTQVTFQQPCQQGWEGEEERQEGEGILVKVPLGLSRSVAGRPHSAASPLSITSTMSQSIIVCNLHIQKGCCQ